VALFIDGPTSTIDDLVDQDSGLLGVAHTTGMNLSTKLKLAQEEIGTDLEIWLPTTATPPAPALEIGQIVVTPPLKRWETMHALELVYRDAYFSLLVDRYQGKWQEYEALSTAASTNLGAIGIGIVTNPVNRARLPVLSSVTGPQSGGTFYASVAWANAAGQEGEASIASSITIPDGNLMTVEAVSPPANAAGFWVYAGPALNSMFRQNNVLLAVGATYTYVPGAVTQGPLPGKGQKPDSVQPVVGTLRNG
jgi:hypothetical protein